jgi:hypothetical protein
MLKSSYLNYWYFLFLYMDAKAGHSAQNRIQSFEYKSYRKILHISYKEHKTHAYMKGN